MSRKIPLLRFKKKGEQEAINPNVHIDYYHKLDVNGQNPRGFVENFRLPAFVCAEQPKY